MKTKIIFIIFTLFIISNVIESCSVTKVAKPLYTQENILGKSFEYIVSKYGAPETMYEFKDGSIIASFSGQDLFDYQPSYFGASQPTLTCRFDQNHICKNVSNKNISSKAFNPVRTFWAIQIFGLITGTISSIIATLIISK